MDEHERTHRSAQSVIEELTRDPRDAQLFAESQIAVAVTRTFTALRKAAGLSQKELAARTGRKQPYIARLEAGAYDRCSLPMLRTFARALGYDLDIAAMIRPLPNSESKEETVR